MTKKQPDQIDAPSRDGAYIHGLTLEGCRWDDKAGVLDDSKPKELFCPMPVILVRPAAKPLPCCHYLFGTVFRLSPIWPLVNPSSYWLLRSSADACEGAVKDAAFVSLYSSVYLCPQCAA